MNLIERVKGIILNPGAEWQKIESEPGDVGTLFGSYVAILAAIPVVAGFIAAALVGVSVPGAGTVYVPVGTALVSAVVGYVLTFVIVYVVALIVDALAPSFGGRKDMASALKLVVYSYTPAWLAGIFVIIPVLSFLGILGLYGFYLLYLGLPILMKSPKERSLLYTVVIIVCAVILSIVVGVIQVRLFF
jgi:hypothetical protein